MGNGFESYLLFLSVKNRETNETDGLISIKKIFSGNLGIFLLFCLSLQLCPNMARCVSWECLFGDIYKLFI